MKDQFKYKFTIYYCIFFYLLMIYKWINGMFLYQFEPTIFLNRFDGFTWVFMLTGIHQSVLNNETAWALFDSWFYAMPLMYLLVYRYAPKWSVIAAAWMLIVNWVYVQCYTLYPTNSIEAHMAWLLFPIAFLVNGPKTFRLLTEGLRYFFLYFFVSAALWKIVNGAVFNPEQMSGVLLYQHADLLSNSVGYWQTELINWLIQHKTFGFLLYVFATVLELFFITGFFTRRFDNWLMIAFIVFLLFDHLVMRIPYYELLPYLITLKLLKKTEFNPAYNQEFVH
jgi:hypothetical protein